MVLLLSGSDFIISTFSFIPVGMAGQSEPKITFFPLLSSSGK